MNNISLLDVNNVKLSDGTKISKIQDQYGTVLWPINKINANFIHILEAYSPSENFSDPTYSITYSPKEGYPGTECTATINISGEYGKVDTYYGGSEICTVTLQTPEDTVTFDSYSNGIKSFNKTITLIAELSEDMEYKTVYIDKTIDLEDPLPPYPYNS